MIQISNSAHSILSTSDWREHVERHRLLLLAHRRLVHDLRGGRTDGRHSFVELTAHLAVTLVGVLEASFAPAPPHRHKVLIGHLFIQERPAAVPSLLQRRQPGQSACRGQIGEDDRRSGFQNAGPVSWR